MAKQVPTALGDRLSASARGMQFSAIRRMSALIERPGIISFAPGQPSPETFPTAAFQEIVRDILAKEGPNVFQYILTRGLGALIGAVSEYVRAKGIRAGIPEILLTEGSQQGLDLVTRVLVDPGDVVLVELPAYVGATSAFRAARARMVGVRLEDDGISIEDLKARHAEARSKGESVKFLYVIPSFQNPSGISHSVECRKALMAAAEELDLLIVEDDPYGDLFFGEAPRPTLKSLDRDSRVIYLSSFSKILAPGLRTAFMIGPPEILEKVEIAKQAANLCGSGLDLAPRCPRGRRRLRGWSAVLRRWGRGEHPPSDLREGGRSYDRGGNRPPRTGREGSPPLRGRLAYIR